MAGQLLAHRWSGLMRGIWVGPRPGPFVPPGFPHVARLADALRWDAWCSVRHVRMETLAVLATLALIVMLGATALVIARAGDDVALASSVDRSGYDREAAVDFVPEDQDSYRPTSLPAWHDR